MPSAALDSRRPRLPRRANPVYGPVLKDAQAIFRRRRHQPRRPLLAKIRPGGPASATGPGTAGYPFPEKASF
jgi:hypothetical protein